MIQIIDGKRYNTETATMIAGDDYWDGHNFERRGRNTFLYKTKKGAFFAAYTTLWQGEQDEIAPVSEHAAKSLFEQLSERRVDYKTAFGEEPEEA